MKRSTTALVALGAVTAAAAGGVLFLGAGGGADAAGKGGDGLPPATATVVRTDLVLSKTVDGRIDFAQRRAVKAAVEGTVSGGGRRGKDRTARAGPATS